MSSFRKVRRVLKDTIYIKRKELISDIIFFLFLIILFKTVLLIGSIESSSMEPTLGTGNIAMYNGWAYTFKEPKRGDIILFRYTIAGEEYKITKRIIGLPEETISFADGDVYIDGKLLEEEYIEENMQTFAFSDYQIPKDAYFVLGDNRENSVDSRFLEGNYINRKEIIGKLLLQIPMSKILKAD